MGVVSSAVAKRPEARVRNVRRRLDDLYITILIYSAQYETAPPPPRRAAVPVRMPTMATKTRPPAEPMTGDLHAFKAGFFRALAHPVRIRILERLVKGDRSVQELQEALGLEQPVVSQQLAVLRSGNIVSGRKEGVSVRYAVRDPLIGTLLDTARQIFNNQLVGTRDLLRQLEREDRRR
jgi:ArsR family transcriptional regulator